MKSKTEKAIQQIPKEINKLAKIIALLGQTLLNQKITHTKEQQKIVQEQAKEERRAGIT